MSGEKLEFTKEQEAAVEHRGTLLVAAAAGSGKTRVLVERLLNRVTEDGCDIDRFLVITYTKAAAAELKERIMDEITQRLSMKPGDKKLKRQTIICSSAPISTIHSFCTNLLRENAHLTNLAPDFRVAEETECTIIKAEVLDEVITAAYETINENDRFRALVDAVSAGWNDRKINEIILDTHAALQSNPKPEQWAEQQGARLDVTGIKDAIETVWGKYLIDRARSGVRFWYEEMRNLREEICDDAVVEKAYGASLEVTVSGLKSFLDALDIGWDEAVKSSEVQFPRPKPLKEYKEIKDRRTRCKKSIDKISGLFESTTKELLEDLRGIAPAVEELLRLITEFGRAYKEEKTRRGVVDFSDLEHLALELLVDKETGEKKQLAREVAARFEEVMIDEYQDVNAVQELIFNAVSREGTNIFMVGDVKQSIYRFRLADPSIFMGKYNTFKDEVSAADDVGRRILLSENFRSRAGVLDAVNYVFKGIMTEEFGEMEYTERECLVPGRRDAGEGEDAALEFDIIDLSDIEQGEDEEGIEKTEAEAIFIAERIMELAGNYEIPDGKGGYRFAEYSDIVILLRSVKDKARRYASILEKYGVPVDTPDGEDFFASMEITAAISILEVIDNPVQDIALVGAMRSPVYGFTAEELAAVRAGVQETDYYTALIKAAETDQKCASFLKEMEAFREVAPDMSTGDFIWHVYNATGMLAVYGAMKSGEKRRRNLMTLLELARRYEEGGHRGLFSFLAHIRDMEERRIKLVTETETTDANAVKIMSIHKSKGLEFPIVIIADTSKRLNNKDAQKPLVMHTTLGVGAMYRDQERRIEYPTLSRIAIQRKMTDEMMAEELRLLYVAMTRAKEKLIITAAYKDSSREIEKSLLNIGKGGQIPPQILAETRSMAGWILMSALTRAESDVLIKGMQDRDVGLNKYAWDMRLVKPSGSMIESDKKGRIIEFPGTGIEAGDVEKEVEKLRERFSFEYPHGSAVRLPSKLTVTELKGRATDYEVAEEAEVTQSWKEQTMYEKPDFIINKTRPTGAERGTALHLAMQYIDYKKCVNTQGVKEEILRLAESKLITAKQAEIVDARKISKLFESEIGKRLLSAEKIEREFKFSLLCRADEFYCDGGDDEILLQGVIDCFIEEGEELTVVDYKTDRITEETRKSRIQKYTPQLTAYSRALERIVKKRVKKRIIYFFDSGEAVEV